MYALNMRTGLTIISISLICGLAAGALAPFGMPCYGVSLQLVSATAIAIMIPSVVLFALINGAGTRKAPVRVAESPR